MVASRLDRAAKRAGYCSWNDFADRVRETATCGEIAVRWAGLELKPAGNGHLTTCPFHPDRTPSLSLTGALFYCHGAGCDAKGDAIGFAMRLSGLGFEEALAELARDAGLPAPELPQRRRKRGRLRKGTASPAKPAVRPSPAEPPELPPPHAPAPRGGALRVRFPRRGEFGLLRAAAWHAYRDRSRRLLCWTARIERASDRGKAVLPVTWRRDAASGEFCWTVLGWGGAPPPVYGMDRLPAAAVSALLVEGEKTADAAARLLGAAGWAALSPMGGGKASARADWRPLAAAIHESAPEKAAIAVWPDADRPKADSTRPPAAEAADRVLGGLARAMGGGDALTAKADCRAVLPPPSLPHGWDLADAEIAGWTAADALAILAKAAPWSPEPGWEL